MTLHLPATLVWLKPWNLSIVISLGPLSRVTFVPMSADVILVYALRQPITPLTASFNHSISLPVHGSPFLWTSSWDYLCPMLLMQFSLLWIGSQSNHTSFP